MYVSVKLYTYIYIEREIVGTRICGCSRKNGGEYYIDTLEIDTSEKLDKLQHLWKGREQAESYLFALRGKLKCLNDDSLYAEEK